MNENKNPSFLPARMQVLSGSGLKLIAMITMLIDHIGVYLLRYNDWAVNTRLNILGNSLSIYQISRDIGRIAFPIFCFLLIEGFRYTRNRFLYARNLLFFALLSEIPWNYGHSGTRRFASQNVFFTLFLGLLGIWAIEYFWEKQYMQILCLLALLMAAVYLNADYGWKGYVFILILYLLRNERAAQAVVGSCWLSYEWKACFAFLPINMYNGERGFIRGKVLKYAFYAFYPLHILILGWMKYHPDAW